MLAWDIFHAIGAGLLIFLFLLMLLVFLIGKGLSEKFGPEWIPYELGISFNHLKISVDTPKITSFEFSAFEAEMIRSQISDLMSGDSQASPVSYPYPVAPTAWTMKDDETYECRQVDTNQTKAIFSYKNRELVYYK